MQKDKKILKNLNLENSFFHPLKRKKQLEVRLQMMKKYWMQQLMLMKKKMT